MMPSSPVLELISRFTKVCSEIHMLIIVRRMEEAQKASLDERLTATVELVFKNGHLEFVNTTTGERLPPPPMKSPGKTRVN